MWCILEVIGGVKIIDIFTNKDLSAIYPKIGIRIEDNFIQHSVYVKIQHILAASQFIVCYQHQLLCLRVHPILEHHDVIAVINPPVVGDG